MLVMYFRTKTLISVPLTCATGWTQLGNMCYKFQPDLVDYFAAKVSVMTKLMYYDLFYRNHVRPMNLEQL